MNTKPKIVIVVGPTASGKSSLAVEIAKRFDGEIISADSRQVYRGLDIGTGKVTNDEMDGVPHHLLDVANPTERYTAANFARDARTAILEIAAREKLPIIAGGTGFYIDAFVGRVSVPEVEPNEKLRAELEHKTAVELLEILRKLDPERAETVEQKNPRRLIRAIEIAEAPRLRRDSGRQAGSVPTSEVEPRCLYDALWIGIDWPDEQLRERIHERLDTRLKSGMVDEIKMLHENGLSWERMDELGLEYRYVSQFLRTMLTECEMRELLEREIWKYAKRQRTYWKRNTDITWYSPEQTETIIDCVKTFLIK